MYFQVNGSHVDEKPTQTKYFEKGKNIFDKMTSGKYVKVLDQNLLINFVEIFE